MKLVSDPTPGLLECIADTKKTRDDVALLYTAALRTPGGADWPKVNRAIVGRWSVAALHYVKDKAWQLGEKGNA